MEGTRNVPHVRRMSADKCTRQPPDPRKVGSDCITAPHNIPMHSELARALDPLDRGEGGALIDPLRSPVSWEANMTSTATAVFGRLRRLDIRKRYAA